MTGASPRWLRLLAVTGIGTVLLVACAPSGATTSSSAKAAVRSPSLPGKSRIACWPATSPPHRRMRAPTSIRRWRACSTVKANQDVPTNPKLADYWVPELATEVPTLENGDVKVSGDRMDVTWKLRHGVKWHDGVAFTSKDVKATFDFWFLKYHDKNPDAARFRGRLGPGGQRRYPDDYTAVVHLNDGVRGVSHPGNGALTIFPTTCCSRSGPSPATSHRRKSRSTSRGGFNGTDRRSTRSWSVPGRSCSRNGCPATI